MKELLVMLRIRLRRTGKKKQPSYRVVVADSRAPRDGDFVETIGLYDPLTDPPTIRIDDEKAKRWLSNGAKPSETVAKLMQRQGILPKQERTAVSAGRKAEAEA
jgi:small subunit ribosomal protein S16